MQKIWQYRLSADDGIDHYGGDIYVIANVQIQLMYTLADRPANVYISWTSS